jgi:hypothetical protein
MPSTHTVEIADLQGSLAADDRVIQDGERAARSKVWLDGYLVPYITADVLSETEVRLYVDDRFSATVFRGQLNEIVWLLANAMAVACGYTEFGNESRPVNLFQRSLAFYDSFEGS